MNVGVRPRRQNSQHTEVCLADSTASLIEMR